MTLALLDVELDLDFRPEAVDALVLIPWTDLELDAEWDLFALREGLEDRLDGLTRRWLPVLHSAIFIGDGVKTESCLIFGRLYRSQESETGFEICCWCARECVENVACDWRRHCDVVPSMVLRYACRDEARAEITRMW